MMDDKHFGALALQLLEQAHIPGSAIDTAVQFREIARNLAEGLAEVKAKDAEQ